MSLEFHIVLEFASITSYLFHESLNVPFPL